jgi:hypothetical protein
MEHKLTGHVKKSSEKTPDRIPFNEKIKKEFRVMLC